MELHDRPGPGAAHSPPPVAGAGVGVQSSAGSSSSRQRMLQPGSQQAASSGGQLAFLSQAQLRGASQQAAVPSVSGSRALPRQGEQHSTAQQQAAGPSGSTTPGQTGPARSQAGPEQAWVRALAPWHQLSESEDERELPALVGSLLAEPEDELTLWG